MPVEERPQHQSQSRFIRSPTQLATKGVEVYYKTQVTRWFAVSGDVQVISPTLSTEDTRVVVGVRGKTNF
jgi:hypothetical protein